MALFLKVAINSALFYLFIPFSSGTLYKAIGINSGFTKPLIAATIGSSVACLVNYYIGLATKLLFVRMRRPDPQILKHGKKILLISSCLCFLQPISATICLTSGFLKINPIAMLVISQISILLARILSVRHLM